jgi:aspartate/methionine/tyrosine aminotransferase
MKKMGEKLIKLHIGDSYLSPTYRLPIDTLFLQENPGFNRYCNTFGIPELRNVLVEKLKIDNNFSNITFDEILITNGATNALNISLQNIVNPGEDVLVLTPCWPFFFGMVRMAGGNVIEVPFYTMLYRDPNLDLKDYLDDFLTENTVAVYFNTPNNPSGKVVDKNQQKQIAQWIQKHNLWLISDEAYDGMTYDDNSHLSIGSLPRMFEQTISIFTFSKVYMFAGLRLGYVVSSKENITNLNKVAVHQLYSPSTLAQQMMVNPVKTRHDWKSEFVTHSQSLRDLCINKLRISVQIPEAGYYLLFSIKDLLKGKNYWDIMDTCIENGVSVAPGKEFGSHYSDYIRLCFTGEPPDRLEVGIERLNSILGI